MVTNFTYKLTETGWAKVTISTDRQSIEFEVSYLSDPLTELIEALLRLLDNASQTEQVVFMGEPGEHVLVLTKLSADSIELLVFQHDGWSDSDLFTITEKKVILSDRTTLITIAKSVQNTANHLLNEFGVEGYKEQWRRYDFPLAPLNELKNRLNLLEQKTNA